MAGNLLDLVWPRGDSELLDRRRGEAIAERVRAFAHLFGVLTIGWTAVDAIAFDTATVMRLLGLRLAASAGFFALALGGRARPSELRQAEMRLALLFAIPALMYLAS